MVHTKKKTVVGFYGKAYSGKSTAANLLVKHEGYHKVAVADPLKNMLIALGLTHNDVYGLGDSKVTPNSLLGGKTPRHAMITLGTEWGRDLIDPDIWVNALRKLILESKHDKFVIEDLRFDNEVELVRSLGGLVLGISRTGQIEPSKGHRSEAHDFVKHGISVIVNDGTIAELHPKLIESMVSLNQ